MKMSALANPHKHQCVLFRLSRRQYLRALAAHQKGRKNKARVHLMVASETAEAGEDRELHLWLNALLDGYEENNELCAEHAAKIVARYNEYNKTCGWGLPDLDPANPCIVPGGDDSGIE